MKVRALIEMLHNLEQSEGDFEMYVRFRRGDDQEFILEIEGVTLDTTDNPHAPHYLVVFDKDDVVQEDNDAN
jgi:hypothetical protein